MIVAVRRTILPPAAMLAGCLGCMLQSGGEFAPDEGDPEAAVHDGGWDGDGDVGRDDTRGDVPREDAVPDDASVEDGESDDASPDDTPTDDAPDDDAAEDAAPDDAGGEVPCPPGVPEACNGLDDDCNGSVDDGMECALGTVSPCGPCALGRKTCTSSCTWSPCVTPADACSPGASESCTPPACAVGHHTCQPTCAWGACVADHSDCTPGTTRGCSLPDCGSGTQACRPDCTWGGCDGTCSGGRSCCPGDGCFDLDWTDQHCGDCATSCGFFSICWDGHCT
ncbi:MAG: hypothetical protein HY907_04720 [Deltaproteobacteria bacterium]|nr:hypothetical protein [Deltaproteobacteria bacterium]